MARRESNPSGRTIEVDVQGFEPAHKFPAFSSANFDAILASDIYRM